MKLGAIFKMNFYSETAGSFPSQINSKLILLGSNFKAFPGKFLQISNQ